MIVIAASGPMVVADPAFAKPHGDVEVVCPNHMAPRGGICPLLDGPNLGVAPVGGGGAQPGLIGRLLGALGGLL